jgi:hypothetical protein
MKAFTPPKAESRAAEKVLHEEDIKIPTKQQNKHKRGWGLEKEKRRAGYREGIVFVLGVFSPSHVRTEQSSEHEKSHRPSFPNPIPVTLFLCPSKLITADGLFVFTSKSLMCGFPAQAMVCLSGEISRRFTCESGNCTDRKQIPEGASQNRTVWS